jgi:hypothetical protein
LLIGSFFFFLLDLRACADSGNSTRSSLSHESAAELSASAPSLLRDQHQWTVYMSRVNLPAVLNDPTLSRREVDIFSKTWGEAFEKAEVRPSPHLQIITAEDFSKYLSKTSSVGNLLFWISASSNFAFLLCLVLNTNYLPVCFAADCPKVFEGF